MIMLNFSEDILTVEEFDFFVERIEEIDRNVLGIVENSLEALFPNVTQNEWKNREFCLIAPYYMDDDGEFMLAFMTCVEMLSRLSGGHVKVFFTYLFKQPISFNVWRN